MTGQTLNTLITSVNGGEEIEVTLATSLVKIGKTILEGERDWRHLRKTDTSLTFSAGGTWQTSYSLAGITDFLRFQNCNYPIEVFDGNNRVEKYRLVPWEDRLQYRDSNNTFVYDEANNVIYFNGTGSFSGTIYLKYIKDTPEIDLTLGTDLKVNGSFPVPARFHDILAFYAVGISKGAIDYDEINKSMLPTNQATLTAIKNAMESWDDKKQLVEVAMTDPYRGGNGNFQSNQINLNE
jgi:hypothetical protein